MNISSVHFNSDVLKADNATASSGSDDRDDLTVGRCRDRCGGVVFAKGLRRPHWRVKTSMKTDYIDVPVNLKWKFGLPIVKAYLAAGPYIGFRVGGDKFWDIPGSVADQVKAKNFSAGLNFGAGVELISHLQVGFNYGLGLTDNYSIEKVNLSDGAGKNRGWSITAAILF